MRLLPSMGSHSKTAELRDESALFGGLGLNYDSHLRASVFLSVDWGHWHFTHRLLGGFGALSWARGRCWAINKVTYSCRGSATLVSVLWGPGVGGWAPEEGEGLCLCLWRGRPRDSRRHFPAVGWQDWVECQLEPDTYGPLLCSPP